MTLIAISHYIEAKFDYDYFIFFLCHGSKILHKKSQVISTKKKDVTAIFPNFDFILNWENQRHVTGGRRPPAGPTGPQGARRAPSPPQELEGWARSAQIF